MSLVEAASTRLPFARSAETAGSIATSGVLVRTAVIAMAAIALRVGFAPQIDGLDDAGYLDAALRVSDGRPLDNLFPLFRTRVGMSYPLAALMSAGWLGAAQFWLLTLAADAATVFALSIAGWKLTESAAAGLAAAALYAIYPLAVQQANMYYPTAFQVASIASAIALIAVAERSHDRVRLALGFVAGLALGIGYLFKEDVALVVPAIMIAAAVARYPRVTTVIVVGAGAALVFFSECVVYWSTTGDALHRLTVTSGLGGRISDQLQIDEIWRWDAFIRSLLILPASVGIMWWIAPVAAVFAWRNRRQSRALLFAAALLIVMMAYLQFGSGSFTSYSPLPKTPRYTALATPALMLICGAWLAALFTTRRRLAAIVTAAVVAAALPCIAFLQVSSSERMRNTMAVATALHDSADAPLYTDYYSARILRLLAPQRDIRVWYHADFINGKTFVMNEPEAGSYALLDHQAAKVYTSSYGLPLPPSVDERPAAWPTIWRHRAFPEGSMARRLLEGLRQMAMRLPSGNPVSSRIVRNVDEIVEGDDAILVRVGAPR